MLQFFLGKLSEGPGPDPDPARKGPTVFASYSRPATEARRLPDPSQSQSRPD
jgi:hypothetical protein